MERVSNRGAIGSVGTVSTGVNLRRSGGADRLPAGNNAPARRERHPEVDDYG